MEAQPSSEIAGSSNWLARPGFAETIACALAFLVYIPTLGFQFVYDDKPQVIQNPAIHAWRYLPHYFTTHVWGELYPNVRGDYYRPLFLLWFRINHALFGVNPKGWHLTTILCHMAVTYLVFVLARRLTASREIAFIASVLFAVDPVHIESVAWVSGVSDPFMAISWIGSFLAYLNFHQTRRPKWIALALTLFVIGLLQKETAVVLAPIVFVYVWIYSKQESWIARFGAAVKDSLAFFVTIVVYLIVRTRILNGLSHSVTPLTWKTMLLTEPSVVWLYVRHLLLPIGISGLYGLPYVNSVASSQFWIPAVCLAIVVVAAIWLIRRMKDPRLAWFAGAWIVLPVIPVLWLRTFSEGDIAHDRYLYIPSMGFVILAALAIAQLKKLGGAEGRNAELAALAILAIAYTAATAVQQSYWASDITLYERAYSIAPHDNLICTNLGTALFESGDSQAAIALYSQVLSREPTYWLSNYDLGYAYYKLGNSPAAEVYLRRALQVNEVDSDTLICLGLSVWKQGRTAEALPYIHRAIEARPSAPGYHFALAMILRGMGDTMGAADEFKQELHYNPDSAVAQQQLDELNRISPPQSN